MNGSVEPRTVCMGLFLGACTYDGWVDGRTDGRTDGS